MSGDDRPGGEELDAMRVAVARIAKASREKKATEPPDLDAEPRNIATAVVETKAIDERLADAVRRAEAVLFASREPVSASQLAGALPPGVEPGDVLVELREAYRGKGVQLVEVAGKWRFQTAPDLAFLFEETREQPRQLSRAALETLAIIAYCQPVTRAEIADVRGVEVSAGTLDVLMEAGWVKPRGRRRTPGRPHTYGVTEAFMVHFGLESLDALPGREDLKAAGLLSAEIPRDFMVPGTPVDPATGELLPEDPLDPGEFQPDFLEGAEDRD
ncbi:MAG: SMC-Scp complex subunit ScpB [Hyphomonadaceae bacterium]